jgi:hypothetical protein
MRLKAEQITKRSVGENVSAESRYNSDCDNMASRELVWKLERRKTWKRFIERRLAPKRLHSTFQNSLHSTSLGHQTKPAVVKYYRSENSWPMVMQELHLSQPTAGRFVTDLSVDRGTISVTFGNQANPLIVGHILSFRPLMTDTGAITWMCGYWARGANADSEIGPNLTDVKRQFLPSECR